MKGDASVRDIKNLPDSGHLYAAHVIHDLWRETGGNAVVVTDVGQHQMWEAQYYHHETPRSLITSGGLGTMGFALPAAIGAKVARPDAEVWAIIGDGGFQMTMAELATIAQEEIDINIAIINNGFLGMVRQWQQFFYEGRYAATPLVNPDFCKLAAAFGLESIRVDERAGVVPAVRAAAQPQGHGADRLPGRTGGLGLPDGAGGQRPRRDDPAAQPDCRDRSGPVTTTFVVRVEDRPGVLTRVAEVFRRRAFNIESLTVGHTETAGESRMTIVCDTDETSAKRLEAHLYKLVNVLRVDNISDRPAVFRDLAMIKVATNNDTRAQVMQLVEVFRARVVDVAPTSLVVEITGTEDKIDGLVEVLRPYGVLEMARTGRVGMVRGTDAAPLRRGPAEDDAPRGRRFARVVLGVTLGLAPPAGALPLTTDRRTRNSWPSSTTTRTRISHSSLRRRWPSSASARRDMRTR